MNLDNNGQTQPEKPSETQENPGAKPDESGISVVTLSRPFMVGGNAVTELRLDLDKLTGEDMDNVESEIMVSGRPSFANPAMSSSYCMRIAARALGVNYEELKRLPIRDASKVQVAVQNFLLT